MVSFGSIIILSPFDQKLRIKIIYLINRTMVMFYITINPTILKLNAGEPFPENLPIGFFAK